MRLSVSGFLGDDGTRADFRKLQGDELPASSAFATSVTPLR
jgi:hypothetical protein